MAGSTGYIGSQVLKTLLKENFNVICIGRNFDYKIKKNNIESVAFHKINLCSKNDFKNIEDLQLQLHAVISCLGTRFGGKEDAWNIEYYANKNILDFAKKLGVKQFILLSAICVQKPKLQFQFAKLAFEKELISSGVCFSIVRPTAYFKSLAGQIEKVKLGKAFVCFDNGQNTSCKPISESDLAEYICGCLTLSERKNQVLPIGGAGPVITPKVQAEMIFRILNKVPKYRKIPSFIFKIFRFFITPLSIFSQKFSDLNEFSKIGHYYATESMLLWDPVQKAYSAEITPEFGEESLEDFYSHVIKFGMSGHELGEHKLF